MTLPICKAPVDAIRSTMRKLATGFTVCALVLGYSAMPAAAAKHRTAAAAPKPKEASFIVDVNSGRVLYSSNADTQTYPASLTKVMTLYILFEQLKAGKLRMDSPIRVSTHAARQAPSRLGVAPGKSLTVENAILALVTKSANDIAVAIAENIGGSENNFARLMTQKAKALGMDRTQYMNASGLPNKGQLTTARDQATLARRMQLDFPQYYHYFGTQSFAWGGQIIKNHNHLLGKYAGMNGLKTGYTAASGFNLTTSVMRDGKSLIGVVLGGRTARDRDKQMVALLDRTMPTALALRDTGTRFAAATPIPAFTPASGISVADRNALAALADDEPDPDEESYTGTEQVASFTAPTPLPPLPSATPVSTKPIAPIAQIAANSDVASRPEVASKSDRTLVRFAENGPVVVNQPVVVKQQPAVLRKPELRPQIAETKVLPTPRPVKLAAAMPALAPATSNLTAPAKPATIDRVKAYTVAALDKAEGPVSRVGREVGNLIVTPAHASEGLQATQIGTANTVSQLPTAQRGWSASDPLIPNGTWIIQIGAYADQGDAVERIRAAIKAAPKELGKAVPVTIPVQTADNRTLYRSRFGGFEGEKQARNACGRLARESISCIAIPPSNWAIPGEQKEKLRG